jgi:hypothetical protein
MEFSPSQAITSPNISIAPIINTSLKYMTGVISQCLQLEFLLLDLVRRRDDLPLASPDRKKGASLRRRPSFNPQTVGNLWGRGGGRAGARRFRAIRHVCSCDSEAASGTERDTESAGTTREGSIRGQRGRGIRAGQMNGVD